MSLRQLAQRLDVDPTFLSRAVRRVKGKKPSPQLLEAIEKALDLDPGTFPETREWFVISKLQADPRLRDQLYRRLTTRRR